MGHPPFPKGATSEEVQLVQRIHQVGGQQQNQVVRQTLSDALEMLVELIEDRARRHALSTTSGTGPTTRAEPCSIVS